jgi:hypothetical protein
MTWAPAGQAFQWRKDTMPMNASSRLWVRIRRVTFAGNLLGGTLTFFYFRFIDQGVESPPVGRWEIAYSVVAFAGLTALGYTITRRWTAPISACQVRGGARPEEAPLVRRRALLVPYVVSGVTAIGWCSLGWSEA